MDKLKYFICDQVSVTKIMRPLQAKKNDTKHIIKMLFIDNVILKTYSCVKNLNKNKIKMLHIPKFKLVKV